MAQLYTSPLEDPTLAALLRACAYEGDAWANPSLVSTSLLIAAATVSWAVQLTGYWSAVDRLWSVTPFVYAGVYAAFHVGNQRLALMAALTTAWGIRLSFNFWRKGGYADEEDYRWAVLRAFFAKHDPLHPLGRELFSLSFVAIYQHVLLWLIVGPACFLAAGAPDGGALGPADALLAAAFLAALGLETWTDETQWAFQSAKYALSPAKRAEAGGDIGRGFCTSGPFAISRHLNFFCEQSQWWIFYCFAVVSGGTVVNWAALGPLLLSLLFLGSTDMTEQITLAKYPTYAAYQRTTSRLMPWAPGPPLDSAAGQALIAALAPEAAGAAKRRRA